MQTKSFDVKVKAAGPDDGLGEGQFEAIMSVFGNEDSYGDVVRPGAFKSDLDRWEKSGDPIPVIWSHDWSDPFSHLGRVVKAEERPEGLWVQAQIEDMDTNPKAAQVYRLLKGRRVTQFSFAYDVIDGGFATADGREVYELREMKVHEVGPCLLGVNQETELLAVKAASMAKAGRVLSQKNYDALRAAHESIGAVLASATPESSDAEKATLLVSELAAAPTPEEPEMGAKGDDRPTSLGLRIAKSEGFAAFRKAHPSGVDGGTPIHIEAKNVGTLADLGFKATLDTTFGEVRPERQPGYRDYLPYDTNNWPTSFLDLITVGTTNSRSLEYAQIVSETNSAAIVAEGALKPLSDLATATADAKVFTYADGFDATNQFLADEPALATFMEGAVRRHLRVLIEDRLLNGAGGAGAPLGVLATTGVQSQAFTTDVITTIANAVQKIEGVGTSPQAIVMNPADAWALRLLKDGDGRYVSGGPFGAGTVQALWGIPVVTARRVAAGTALVGNFAGNVTFLQREPLSVLAFNQHKDYAQRNMVYVRAELRAMQLVYAPREIVVADLTA